MSLLATLKEKLLMLPRTIWNLTRTTFKEWWKDHALRLSAALSYYVTLSLAPLLLIIIGIAGLLMGDNDARDAIMRQVSALVGPTGARAVEQMLTAREPESGLIAASVGVFMLLFAATGVVGQLQGALNTVWEVKPRPGSGLRRVLRTRVVSFAMILGIGFLLLVSLVVSAAIESFASIWDVGTQHVVKALHFLLSTGVITVLFAMMFKFLPDVELKWRNIWFGALVTALLFSLGKTLTGLYIAKSSLSSSYGAAGSFVIILVWVYFSSASFLLGAEFTQAFTRYREGRPPKKPGVVTQPKEA